MDEDLEELRFARMRTELDPEDPEGHLQLGWLLLRHGRLEGADSALERVLEIESGDPWARYLRSHIAHAWGQPERAAQEFAKLLRRFPDVDLPWPGLQDAVDAMLRRAHLYVSMAFFFAGASALVAPASSLIAVVAIAMLVIAAVVVGIRWAMTARRLGGPLLRSLLRMRARQATEVRLSLVADAVAALGVLGIALAPVVWAKPLGGLVLVALFVAGLAHVFRARET